jgi:hypothetical protein
VSFHNAQQAPFSPFASSLPSRGQVPPDHDPAACFEDPVAHLTRWKRGSEYAIIDMVGLVTADLKRPRACREPDVSLISCRISSICMESKATGHRYVQ